MSTSHTIPSFPSPSPPSPGKAAATIRLSRTLNFRNQSATSSAIDMILDRVRITNPSANAASITVSTPRSLTDSPGYFPIRMETIEPSDHLLECSVNLCRWTSVAVRHVPEASSLTFRDTELFAAVPNPPRLFYRISRK